MDEQQTSSTSPDAARKVIVITPDQIAKMGLTSKLQSLIKPQLKKSTPSKTPQSNRTPADNKFGTEMKARFKEILGKKKTDDNERKQSVQTVFRYTKSNDTIYKNNSEDGEDRISLARAGINQSTKLTILQNKEVNFDQRRLNQVIKRQKSLSTSSDTVINLVDDDEVAAGPIVLNGMSPNKQTKTIKSTSVFLMNVKTANMDEKLITPAKKLTIVDQIIIRKADSVVNKERTLKTNEPIDVDKFTSVASNSKREHPHKMFKRTKVSSNATIPITQSSNAIVEEKRMSIAQSTENKKKISHFDKKETSKEINKSNVETQVIEVETYKQSTVASVTRNNEPLVVKTEEAVTVVIADDETSPSLNIADLHHKVSVALQKDATESVSQKKCKKSLAETENHKPLEVETGKNTTIPISNVEISQSSKKADLDHKESVSLQKEATESISQIKSHSLCDTQTNDNHVLTNDTTSTTNETPVVNKRKRGRPPKKSTSNLNAKLEESPAVLATSTPEKESISQKNSKLKESKSLYDTQTCDTTSTSVETPVVNKRKRGRPPKKSLTSNLTAKLEESPAVSATLTTEEELISQKESQSLRDTQTNENHVLTKDTASTTVETPVVIKRKRGRPPKKSITSNVIAEVEERPAVSATSTPEVLEKRTRKRKILDYYEYDDDNLDDLIIKKEETPILPVVVRDPNEPKRKRGRQKKVVDLCEQLLTQAKSIQCYSKKTHELHNNPSADCIVIEDDSPEASKDLTNKIIVLADETNSDKIVLSKNDENDGVVITQSAQIKPCDSSTTEETSINLEDTSNEEEQPARLCSSRSLSEEPEGLQENELHLLESKEADITQHVELEKSIKEEESLHSNSEKSCSISKFKGDEVNDGKSISTRTLEEADQLEITKSSLNQSSVALQCVEDSSEKLDFIKNDFPKNTKNLFTDSQKIEDGTSQIRNQNTSNNLQPVSKPSNSKTETNISKKKTGIKKSLPEQNDELLDNQLSGSSTLNKSVNKTKSQNNSNKILSCKSLFKIKPIVSKPEEKVNADSMKNLLNEQSDVLKKINKLLTDSSLVDSKRKCTRTKYIAVEMFNQIGNERLSRTEETVGAISTPNKSPKGKNSEADLYLVEAKMKLFESEFKGNKTHRKDATNKKIEKPVAINNIIEGELGAAVVNLCSDDEETVTQDEFTQGKTDLGSEKIKSCDEIFCTNKQLQKSTSNENINSSNSVIRSDETNSSFNNENNESINIDGTRKSKQTAKLPKLNSSKTKKSTHPVKKSGISESDTADSSDSPNVNKRTSNENNKPTDHVESGKQVSTTSKTKSQESKFETENIKADFIKTAKKKSLTEDNKSSCTSEEQNSIDLSNVHNVVKDGLLKNNSPVSKDSLNAQEKQQSLNQDNKVCNLDQETTTNQKPIKQENNILKGTADASIELNSHDNENTNTGFIETAENVAKYKSERRRKQKAPISLSKMCEDKGASKEDKKVSKETAEDNGGSEKPKKPAIIKLRLRPSIITSTPDRPRRKVSKKLNTSLISHMSSDDERPLIELKEESKTIDSSYQDNQGSEQPKRRRGRPRKNPVQTLDTPLLSQTPLDGDQLKTENFTEEVPHDELKATISFSSLNQANKIPEPPKRRGRPKKIRFLDDQTLEESVVCTHEDNVDVIDGKEHEYNIVTGRKRKRKMLNYSELAEGVDEQISVTSTSRKRRPSESDNDSNSELGGGDGIDKQVSRRRASELDEDYTWTQYTDSVDALGDKEGNEKESGRKRKRRRKFSNYSELGEGEHIDDRVEEKEVSVAATPRRRRLSVSNEDFMWTQSRQQITLAKIFLDDIKKRVEENLQGIMPKSELGEGICLVCLKSIPNRVWNYHRSRYHNDIAWRVNDEPMDLDKTEKMITLLKKIALNKKPMWCDKCETMKKSLFGFLVHRFMCKRTEEELYEHQIPCSECGVRLYGFNMGAHLKTHRNPPKKDTEENLDVTMEELADDGTPRKRQAAEKASKLIKNVVSDAPIDPKKLKKMYYKDELPETVLKEKLQSSSDGVFKCLYEDCNSKYYQIEEAIQHYKECRNRPSTSFTCKSCYATFYVRAEIANHVVSMHMDKHDDDYVASESEGIDDGDEGGEKLSKWKIKCVQTCEYKCYSLKFLPSKNTSKGWSNFQDVLQFHRNNYNSTIYPNLRFSKSEWSPLDSKFIINYLPLQIKSLSIGYETLKTLEFSDTPSDLHYKQYRLFETSINQGNSTIYCGGPISSMAWAPTPYNRNDCTQILAIGVLRDACKSYKNNETYREPNLIQFWNCGLLHSDTVQPMKPELAFCIAHDFGATWCMEWCPSGVYEPDENRLGLLAASTSNKFSVIYSVPLPQNLSSSEKIYKVQPLIKLMIRKTSGTDIAFQEFQVSKLSWTKCSGHQYIAAGCTNGLILLYNLHAEAPTLRSNSGSTMILYPYAIFKAANHIISGLVLHHLNGGRKWLATCSQDKSMKLWDLDDTASHVHEAKRLNVENVVWPVNWLSTVNGHGDLAKPPYATTLLPIREFAYSGASSTLYSNSVVKALTASEWGNIVMQGSTMGEISGYQIEHTMAFNSDFSFKRFYCGHLKVVQKPESAGRKNKRHDVDYKQFTEHFNAVFADFPLGDYKRVVNAGLKLNSKSNFQYPNYTSYPIEAATAAAANPNQQSYLHTAVGFQMGFVRIFHLKFLDLKYEQFS